jgi:pimeloyl-ACP methyl ester carboxylesterase
VGHSYGGRVARAFAGLYPKEEVVGMMLADSSRSDQWARLSVPYGDKTNTASSKIASFLTRMRIMCVFDRETSWIATGLPARQYAEMKA